MSADTRHVLLSAVRAGDVDRVKKLIDTFVLSYGKEWSEGYTLLIEAVVRGHIEVARLLLISGANVNSENTRPTETPLHFAVKNNDVEIVNMLLDRHADVNAVDKHGRTSLQVAYAIGTTEIIDLLVNNMTQVDATSNCGKTQQRCKGSKKGYTPLHGACKRNNQKLVELFLREGADINASTEDKLLLKHGGADINAQNKNGKTVLQIAIEKGDLLTVTHILELCPEINNQENSRCDALYGRDIKTCRKVIKTQIGYEITVNFEDAKNIYLLHVAVEKGRLKIIEDLLKYSPDINCSLPDNEGYTLLHNAANNNQVEAARLLINYGADINAKDINEKLPLCYAIDKNDVNMMTLLLSSGTKINDRFDQFWISLKYKSKDIVEVLLRESYLHPKGRDLWGQTALHHSSRMYDYDSMTRVMKMLVDKGAEVNAKDDSGRTPLYCACEHQEDEAIVWLLEHGADIESKNNGDSSPLEIAVCGRCPRIVKILLEHFAEVERTYRRKVCSRYSVLHIATFEGLPEIVEELLQYGADINSTFSDGFTPLDHALNGVVFCVRRGYGRMLYFFEQIVKILKQHIVKIKALNLYLSPRNLKSVDIENEYKEFYTKCKYEVEMMKNEKINDTNISLNDLLTNCMGQLGIYAENKSIVEILELRYYKKKFPIYADIIYNNFKRGHKREGLLRYYFTVV